MSRLQDIKQHVYPQLKKFSEEGDVLLRWGKSKELKFRIKKGKAYYGTIQLFNGTEYFFAKDIESFSRILETGQCEGEDVGGRPVTLEVVRKDFDLQEYNEGTDGFSASLPEVLQDAGYRGSVREFYCSLWEILITAAEKDPKNPVHVKQKISLPDSEVSAEFSCIFNDSEVFRVSDMQFCEVKIDGETFDISSEMLDLYTKAAYEGNVRFKSEEETSMLEIAKKIRR